MLKPKQLDDLSQRLANSLPAGLQTLRDDVSRNLRATLEAGLAKLELVTREEFEVQAAVLARTRAKLQALESHVSELEHRLEIGQQRKRATSGTKTSTHKSNS
jgi:BMFP domain-containing protein YqiC